MKFIEIKIYWKILVIYINIKLGKNGKRYPCDEDIISGIGMFDIEI